MIDPVMKEVSTKLNIPYEDIENVIKTFFSFVRMRISKVAYKDIESFEKIKTNFVIPGFGKLVVKNKLNRKKYEREKRESRRESSKTADTKS